jgi:hypothetical protein
VTEILRLLSLWSGGRSPFLSAFAAPGTVRQTGAASL